MFVTFTKIPGARTGNILFQYLFCIRISILYGHTYTAIEDLSLDDDIFKKPGVIKLTDENATWIDSQTISDSFVICEGFFQNDSYYLPIRERLLAYLKTTEDSWIGFYGNREYMRNYLFSSSSHIWQQKDIVMTLRLDDYIHSTSPTSNILPPYHYLDILEKLMPGSDGRLIIVSDILRYDWEHKYMEYFQKWSPTIVSGTLSDDFALMRDCNILLHSNSTLCWFASFLSENKTARYIPVTRFYSGQHLEAICLDTDKVFSVQPMEHKEIYALNVMCWHRDICSLPYCIPESVFPETVPAIENKKYVISPLIPGDTSNYLFSAGEEAKYYEMYRDSMFAITKRKGGWDCLRHYEILAAGCIPIFEDLDKCPLDTLVSLPKTLLLDAYKVLLPWQNTEEQRSLYPQYLKKLWAYTKDYCSTMANAKQFLKDMSHIGSCPKNILLLVGHSGVNYTRELNWIGLKQWADSVGSNAVEYPPLDFLYDDFPAERLSELYGNGFTYSRRLPSSLRKEFADENALIESIQQKKWDMVIYGKVGPDETVVGSVPNLPYWEHVFKRYSRDEIVFWYGGDGMQDMTYANRYSDHLVKHSQYARCFVREFIRWGGAHT